MVKNFFLYAFFCFQIVWGQTNNGESLKTNQSFHEGEWFQLRLHYGPFNASYATLSLERDTINGHPVYHAKGFGETTGLASWFFKVEDYYESYFDEETGLPYKFIRNINEGGYTKNIEIDFNHKEKIAVVNNKKIGEFSELQIKNGVQDLISSFYYLRNFYPKDEIKVNESFDINMFFDFENYVFRLKYLGKEIINTKFGKIKCMKFRPIVQSGRVFEEQESVTLWVSDDKNRIPVRIKADILVGSIKADLENFKNLKHPFKIIVK
ncbi:MAG: ATP-dependent exonuclease [Flavobacteriaceae bacterium TMED68]|nr:MAG: ATP-dependent exonuclease [Flavobacteriaceae bacterium TMED68]|tara:strand:+ start:8551 stop:9348 length:798 start_codon:yes stop_codon:yes gene_type:complete